MAALSKTYDVFVSHAPADARWAMEVAEACRANGLEAITYGELLQSGADVSDALWEALSESRAVLAIVPPSGPTPSMFVELGGARAWHKPIFGLVADAATGRAPAGLSDMQMYTSGRLDDVIQAVKRSSHELSDEDRSYLVGLYGEMGVSVDEFVLDSAKLDRLVRRFSAEAGKSISGERLLSELLRMRKQGRLLPKARSARLSPRQNSA